MISNQSRTQEWILAIRELSPGRDPILIEKMIMALTLVENLRLAGLDFIFKGGTSLLLLLGTPQRFSIDVDIVLDADQNLDVRFATVLEQGAFLRYEENRRAGDMPKQHFKFFFHSIIQNQESHILLDILFQKDPYPKLQEVPLISPLLATEGKITTVICPVIECLLGDKLSAFAPNTTGVRYGMNKELEIAKQLFDVGILFDAAEDVPLVAAAFNSMAAKELRYRHLPDLTPADALSDAFQTACLIGMRGYPPQPQYPELLNGFRKLAAFIYSGFFSLDSAILCASKTAYLCALIQTQHRKINRFDKNSDLSPLAIANPDFNKLNKIKKTSLEAFFYFYHALQLLDRRSVSK
jgi:hypothetical protein